MAVAYKIMNYKNENENTVYWLIEETLAFGVLEPNRVLGTKYDYHIFVNEQDLEDRLIELTGNKDFYKNAKTDI